MSFGTDKIQIVMCNLLNLSNEMQDYETKSNCQIKELTDKMHEHLGIISKQNKKIKELQLKLDNPLRIKADPSVEKSNV